MIGGSPEQVDPKSTVLFGDSSWGFGDSSWEYDMSCIWKQGLGWGENLSEKKIVCKTRLVSFLLSLRQVTPKLSQNHD